jgi:FkbM family methyltransferase
MILFLKYILKNLFRFLTEKNYRTFHFLMLVYGDNPRFRSRKVKFNRYKVTVPDTASFIWQYKEIFTEEFYKFNAHGKPPLIYDCGSNIGISCLFYHHHFKNPVVKAFEADPVIAEILKSNLKQNNIQGIEVIPKAVWVNDEGLEIYPDGADGASLIGEGKSISIPTVRLKSLLEKETYVDFLKMDIEGAETAVIEDIKDCLYKIHHIFIEYHSYHHQPQSMDSILAALSYAGLRYYCLPVHIRKSPFVNTSKDRKMDYQINIFAYKER